MALSPCKNSESSPNRSRSSSYSSPVRNRIVYHEIYSLGANTLVRSYSCDQVFDKDASGRTFQTTQIQVSSFITPEKKTHAKSIESKSNEPRRLALEYPVSSSNIVKPKAKSKEPRRLALEYPVSSPDIVKPKAKSSMRHQQQKVVVTVLKRTMIFSLLTVASACAFLFYITNRENNYVWDLEKTEYELKNNIFGQDQAVAKINSVLKICNSTKDTHVLIFTGGVGVGKTYSSSIISRNFPWSSNKLITYSEYFTADIEKLLKHPLSTVGYNLIIVDDLSAKATKEAVNLVALLNSNRKKNEKLLIILIFQVHSETDRNEITGNFKNTYFNVYHAPFKPLTQDAIEKCFNAEIQRQEVKISYTELRKLVEDKMKYIDVIKGPPGCKGVADEVAFFFKKN